jgi:DNA polymerase V
VKDDYEHPFPDDPRDLRQLGFRSGAAEYLSHVLSLDQHIIQNPYATFFWKAKGDEARILGIKDGDLLIVDRSEEPRHDDIVVCIIDRVFRIRRIRRFGDLLIPAPLRRSEKMDPFESCEVWGVIVFVVREFKHPNRARRL